MYGKCQQSFEKHGKWASHMVDILSNVRFACFSGGPVGGFGSHFGGPLFACFRYTFDTPFPSMDSPIDSPPRQSGAVISLN